MKALFSIVGLLLVLAIVGMLARLQVGASSKSVPPPLGAAGVSVPVTTPGASSQQQSLEIQQQVKKSVEAATQPARAVPDDK